MLIQNNVELAKAFIDLQKFPFVSIDIETTGLNYLDDEILLITLGNKLGIYVIDVKSVDYVLLGHSLNLLKTNPKITLIGHNLKFDLKFLYTVHGVLFDRVIDTFILEALLNAGKGSLYASLEELAKKYCNVELSKETREEFSKKDFKITDEIINYAENDVKYLYDIYLAQNKQIEELKLSKVAELEFRLLPVVMTMEVFGIGVDIEGWNKNIEKLKSTLPELELKIKNLILDTLSPQLEGKNLYEVAKLLAIPIKNSKTYLKQISRIDFSRDWLIQNININSAKQVLTIFQLMGINIPNTNEQTLQDYSEHEVVKLLLEYRGVNKLITTYGENILNYVNKYTKSLHPEFNQVGTVTGRFSSSNPNAQNIPHTNEFRNKFIAREGCKIITADYNQQEYRLAAAVSGDERIINAYKNGHDMHTLTASLVYKVPLEEVKKEQRQVGKTINFLTLYGGSATKLHKVLGFDLQTAKDIVSTLNNTKLSEFRTRYGEIVYEKGYSVTLFGRKRFYEKPVVYSSIDEFNQIKSRIQRQGFNTLIQGTGADIVKLAMVKCFYENPFGLDKFKIILQVHDEIVFEVAEEIAEQAAEFIKNCMEEVEQPFLGEVPAKAEVVINDYWTK